MIGIVDGDTFLIRVPFVPNLQLMKLYRFLRNNYIDCKLLNWYSSYEDAEKVYLWVQNNMILPEEFFLHPNLILGGGKFYNYKYVPFQNEAIENTEPDPNLYEVFLSKVATYSLKSNTLLKSGYLRLESPGKFQESQLHKNGTLFLYDYDMNHDESKMKMKYIKQKGNIKTFYFRSPQFYSYDNMNQGLDLFRSSTPRKTQKDINKLGIFNVTNIDQLNKLEQLNNNFKQASIYLGYNPQDDIMELFKCLHNISATNKRIGFVWRQDENYKYNALLTAISSWFALEDKWNHTILETAGDIGMKLNFLQNVEDLGLKDTKYWNFLSLKPAVFWRLLHE